MSPAIHQYESKNGSVWRVSKYTTVEQVPVNSAVPLRAIINLSGKVNADGDLNWTPPPENGIVVRIGHTSTGHTNATEAVEARGWSVISSNPCRDQTTI